MSKKTTSGNVPDPFATEPLHPPAPEPVVIARESETKLTIGCKVRVKSGDYAGMVGIVQYPDLGHKTYTVQSENHKHQFSIQPDEVDILG